MKALAMEFYKTKRRKVWLIIAALLFVQLLWSAWATDRMNEHVLQQGWMYFLYQTPALNAIILPVIAAVLASRLSDTEHKGQTFKLLNTLMRPGKLFDAKLLCGAFYIGVVSILQVCGLLLIGKLRGVPGEIPTGQYGLHLLFTFCVSITIYLLQMAISLLCRNQMIPLVVGLTGSLCGLFLMFLPSGLRQKVVLWGNYGTLALVRLDWDITTRVADFYFVAADWSAFWVVVLWFLLIYIVGRTLFVHKEV